MGGASGRSRRPAASARVSGARSRERARGANPTPPSSAARVRTVAGSPMGGASGRSRRPASVAFTPDETRVPVVVPHRPGTGLARLAGPPARRSGRPGAAARAFARLKERDPSASSHGRQPSTARQWTEGRPAVGDRRPARPRFFSMCSIQWWSSAGSSTSPASVAERRPLFAQL